MKIKLEIKGKKYVVKSWVLAFAIGALMAVSFMGALPVAQNLAVKGEQVLCGKN